MRFDEQVHWSEGLFMQPQHLQRMQRGLEDLSRRQRELSMSFPYGLTEFELDGEALKSRRVVVKRLSAVMPDGQELSMPGNCSVAPLTLDFDGSASGGAVTVYLRLPRWSTVEPNLTQSAGAAGRFLLRETQLTDENTSDNEIPVMVRTLNASLTADPHDDTSFTLLPVVRLNWSVINSSQPMLTLDDDYMPPFLRVSSDCPLLSMCGELVFQLRSSRNSMLSVLSQDGFDPVSATSRSVLRVMRLQSVNRYEHRLFSELVPDRITPYALYLELLSLLGELEAQEPLARTFEIKNYVHDDAMPAFKALLERIRGILLQGGVSSALSFEFVSGTDGCLELEVKDERVYEAGEIFIALSYTGDLNDRVADIEEGDKFRLLNRGSYGDRIRGVKLARLRFPPHYLPNLPGTVWFRLMTSESERMWTHISEEKRMIIDCVHDIFPNLKAALYVNVAEKGNS